MEEVKTKENKTKKIGEIFKVFSKKKKIIAAAICVVVLLVAGFVIHGQNEEGKIATITASSLKKMIEISELSTLEYTYNAVATKYYDDEEETEDNIKYHVAYEGTIKAGISFDEVDIDIEDKLITITIPDVKVLDVNVNMGTMEYIFAKEKYETEKVSVEAYKLCKEDLNKRAENEKILFETAHDNAVSAVEAMFMPWIESVEDEYTVEIK